MFDSVSREKYEAERDARVRAEARAEAFAEHERRLTELLASARDEKEDLLDRLAPKSSPLPFGAPDAAASTALTPEEIIRTPAIGRRGVAARQHRYDEAVTAQDETKRLKAIDERNAALTPEELEEIDRVTQGHEHGTT